MATQVPPKRAAAYSFECSLVSQADTDIFKTTVTLAAGDVVVSKDGGGVANIATLPTEIAATGILTVALSAAEMTADRIVVLFHDATGSEWQDLIVNIHTVTTSQIDDLATATALAALNDLSAAQVWAYATRTLSSFGTLIASIWSYATRTLTMSGDEVVAVVQGSAVTVKSHTRWIIPITSVGNLVGRTKLYFTIKSRYSDTDAQSLCQVEETAGLLVFNGGAPVAAGNGTLVVDDPVAGDFTVTVEVAETASADPALYRWDLKRFGTTPDPLVVVEGLFTVSNIVTRRTS